MLIRVSITILVLSSSLALNAQAVRLDPSEQRFATLERQQARWPLPIPAAGALRNMESLRGALVHFEWGDVQVEEATWIISPEGDLTFQYFRGYDSTGNLFVHEATRPRGRLVDRLDDLIELRIGDPLEPESIIDVDYLAFGIGDDGFLRIVDYVGVYRETGLSATGAPDADVDYTCGEDTIMGCNQHDCTGQCGQYPGCACTQQGNPNPGLCQGYTRTRCSGSCPAPLICFNNAGNCGCHRRPTPDTGEGAINSHE